MAETDKSKSKSVPDKNRFAQLPTKRFASGEIEPNLLYSLSGGICRYWCVTSGLGGAFRTKGKGKLLALVKAEASKTRRAIKAKRLKVRTEQKVKAAKKLEAPKTDD